MNYEMMQGRWKQIHGWVIGRFGRISSDRFLLTEGLRERIEGRLQYSQGKAHLARLRAENSRRRA